GMAALQAGNDQVGCHCSTIRSRIHPPAGDGMAKSVSSCIRILRQRPADLQQAIGKIGLGGGQIPSPPAPRRYGRFPLEGGIGGLQFPSLPAHDELVRSLLEAEIGVPKIVAPMETNAPLRVRAKPVILSRKQTKYLVINDVMNRPA